MVNADDAPPRCNRCFRPAEGSRVKEVGLFGVEVVLPAGWEWTANQWGMTAVCPSCLQGDDPCDGCGGYGARCICDNACDDAREGDNA